MPASVIRRQSKRPGRPPASAKGRDSRSRLIDAAAVVFAERGFRSATVDDVVAAAGLSKGTFYWNFSSKEDLFLTLLEERVDRPVQRLMELTRDAPADRATAPDVSRGFESLLSDERSLLLLVHEYWMAAARDEAVAERYRERQATLRKLLAAALASRHEKTGVPLAVPAASLATAFVALAEGLAGAALVEPDTVDASLFGEILSLVYEGLEARGRKAAA
ncbi:MAG TPA: helix-turn-helix domain-containing protein [Solirubrobacterales bacterium]